MNRRSIIEFSVILIVIFALLLLAAFLSPPDGPWIERDEIICKMNLSDLYKYCMQYYTMGQDSFPFAGDGADACKHWQVLFDGVRGISPNVLKCPAMRKVKVAEPDPDTDSLTLEPENISYAYAKRRRTPEDRGSLLAGDKDFKRSDGKGEGHLNRVIVLKCDGEITEIRVEKGQSWEEAVNGELVRPEGEAEKKHR